MLSACATKLQEPPTQPETVKDALPETTEVPGEWSAPADDMGDVDDGWLRSFNDPELESLVDEALSYQNPNMRLLAAQVDRAVAQARLAGAALKPTVSLGADLSGTGGDAALSGGSAGVGVVASWEWDVWGRVQAGASAAEENLRATVADFEYARQSLAANVAKTWYLATELELQTQLAGETVEILSKLVDLVEKKHEVGQVSMQDVHLVRADLASAEDALRQAIGGQQQAQRALELLLGRYPAAEIETADELIPVPPPVPVGLPSTLLERRPDLIAAERRVAAAFLLTEQARLAKLPRFTLTAGVGASSDLNDAIGNLGTGLFAPLFAGGALEAQLESATADQEAAIAAYGATALSAFEEVESALVNEKLLEERQGFLASAEQENLKAYELAQIQYDVGKIDLLSVLQMQSRWNGARIGLVRIENERLTQRINLHLALGGSFASGNGPNAASERGG
jgi:NodT family efflux transporter outer membrane factor (OMF) lipoprotein